MCGRRGGLPCHSAVLVAGREQASTIGPDMLNAAHLLRKTSRLSVAAVEGGEMKRDEMIQKQAINDILDERKRQDSKWGVQNHDAGTWALILAEEFGELSEASLHKKFGGPKADDVRKEAVHVAAVAMAIVECLDRRIFWGNDDAKA